MIASPRMPFKLEGEKFEVYIKQDDEEEMDIKMVTRKQLFSI
jgi:hypothetical protein